LYEGSDVLFHRGVRGRRFTCKQSKHPVHGLSGVKVLALFKITCWAQQVPPWPFLRCKQRNHHHAIITMEAASCKRQEWVALIFRHALIQIECSFLPMYYLLNTPKNLLAMVAGAGGREAQDPLTETRGAAPALNA